MSGLSAGELDREVTVQALTDSVGTDGFPIETWALFDVMWMGRREMRGYERFRAGINAGAAETVWTLQYREDMDPELLDVVKVRRLVYAGRSYDITAAIVIGRGEGIELTTLERVG